MTKVHRDFASLKHDTYSSVGSHPERVDMKVAGNSNGRRNEATAEKWPRHHAGRGQPFTTDKTRRFPRSAQSHHCREPLRQPGHRSRGAVEY